jgi:hypothetical protein
MNNVLSTLLRERSHSTAPLFPFVEYWWLYLGLTVFLSILLIVDSKKQSPPRREAILWMGISGISALVLISRC